MGTTTHVEYLVATRTFPATAESDHQLQYSMTAAGDGQRVFHMVRGSLQRHWGPPCIHNTISTLQERSDGSPVSNNRRLSYFVGQTTQHTPSLANFSSPHLCKVARLIYLSSFRVPGRVRARVYSNCSSLKGSRANNSSAVGGIQKDSYVRKHTAAICNHF